VISVICRANENQIYQTSPLISSKDKRPREVGRSRESRLVNRSRASDFAHRVRYSSHLPKIYNATSQLRTLSVSRANIGTQHAQKRSRAQSAKHRASAPSRPSLPLLAHRVKQHVATSSLASSESSHHLSIIEPRLRAVELTARARARVSRNEIDLTLSKKKKRNGIKEIGKRMLELIKHPSGRVPLISVKCHDLRDISSMTISSAWKRCVIIIRKIGSAKVDRDGSVTHRAQ